MRKILWLAVALAACGDPLVTGEYRGEPLVELQGNLLIRSVARTPETLNVALFWMNRDFYKEPWQLAEQPVVSRGLALSRYQLQLYQPPPAVALQEMPNGQRAGVALLMLYNDSDRDNLWSEERELLVGGSSQYVLLYAPEALEADAVGVALPAGYHLMRLGDPAERCQSGAPMAAMTVAEGSPEVNLVAFGQLSELLPDLDCDGYIGDWCERLLDEDSPRAEAFAGFLTCLERVGLSQPCLEALPPEVFFGDVIDEGASEDYARCVQDNTPAAPYVPEDECNFFLQEIQWASSLAQVEALQELYARCLEDYGLPQ
jgi:hypothetical protein